MRSYRFTVPGFPVGKQRPRIFTRKGSKFPTAITPKKTQDYEALIKSCAIAAGVEQMEYANVHVVIFLPPRVIPRKTMPDILKEPKQRPDIDNVLKCVLDALNEIAYKDDKNVMLTSIELVCTNNSEAHIMVDIHETSFIIIQSIPVLEGE